MAEANLHKASSPKTQSLLIIAIVACAIIAGLMYYKATHGNVSISTEAACLKSVPENEIRPCLDSLYVGSTYTISRVKFKNEHVSFNSQDISWSSNSISQTLLWIIAAISGLALCVAIYFAPSIVAQSRGCKSTAGIAILNTFMGWTLIGWVASLIWAVTGVTSEKATEHTHIQQAPIAISEIEQLSLLHKSGHISDDEFVAAKKKLLGL